MLTIKQKKEIKKRAKRILHTYGDYRTRDRKILMIRAIRYIIKYGGYVPEK